MSPPHRRSRGVGRSRSEELRLQLERKGVRYMPRLFFLLGLGILIRFFMMAPPMGVVFPLSQEQDAAEYSKHMVMDALESTTTTAEQEKAEEATTVTVIKKNEKAEEDTAIADATTVSTPTAKATMTTTAATTTNNQNTSSCPDIHIKQSTKVYKKQFLKDFPVQIEGEEPIPKDWNTIPCSNMPSTCDLTNTTYGHPFLMISFGRSGTTSTWDIMASLTGEYIPRATEDMGRDKKESVAFFAQRNQTEHGKCWLERLLCRKQAVNIRASRKGYGYASVFGSKWKPWHLGLNTTQARQALQWLGTQKQIKVVYNTRNMIDMFISMRKHTFLQKLFGNERTAHCYDDRELQLSEEAWQKLVDMGIHRATPCVQIFKLIESKIRLKVSWMMDYFERNVLQTDYAAQMLKHYNVSHVRVTYEKLYFRETAREWTRMFQYLGFGPQSNLTLEEVFAQTTFQKTSSHDRSKRMANYDEVYNALRCTRYAEYLD